MRRFVALGVLALASIFIAAAQGAPQASGDHIVVLKDGADPAAVVSGHKQKYGALAPTPKSTPLRTHYGLDSLGGAATRARVAAQSAKATGGWQVRQVDETYFLTACQNMQVTERDVGTERVMTHPDGSVETRFEGRATLSNLDNGRSFDLTTDGRVTESVEEVDLPGDLRQITTRSTFDGLNYRIERPEGPIVSQGHGVIEVIETFDSSSFFPVEIEINDEASKGLFHLSDVLCALLLDGSVMGRVVDAQSGEPVGGVDILAYDADKEQFGILQIGEPRPQDGRFWLGLQPGRYVLVFIDRRNGFGPNGSERYATEWYDDIRVEAASLDDDPTPAPAGARVVEITGGLATSGVAVALSRGAGISGRVTDEVTGDPLYRVCVEAVDPATGELAALGVSDRLGRYRIGGLLGGTYALRFAFCLGGGTTENIGEWYDNASSLETAKPVSVRFGRDVSKVDAALARGGTIAGTVTADADGSPLERICVDAQGPEGQRGDFTAADGTYRIGGLPAGDYTVQFSDCAGFDTYLDEWYDDKPSADSADPVHVNLGQTSVANAGLARGGSISGHLTDATTGDPLQFECLTAQTVGGQTFFANTDETGDYRLGGLATGTYKVEFTCPGDPDEAYSAEWYDDKPDMASADPVTVTAGIDTLGIDAALQPLP